MSITQTSIFYAKGRCNVNMNVNIVIISSNPFYITGNEELAKKHPNITAAINGKGSTKKEWEKGKGEETANEYLTRLAAENEMCLGGECEEGRITEDMITASKHAIMGDENSRSAEDIKRYKAGHQYRINMYK